MAEDSPYVLEPIREGTDFTLYRGSERGDPAPILAVAVNVERPSPQSLRRLEYECSLATELDRSWAAQPLELTRHQGRTILVLRDPGGEFLDRVIEQQNGQPIDLAQFLRIAIGVTAALGHAHRQGLIHKDVKPENVIVDDAGRVWLTGFGIASRLLRERKPPTSSENIDGSFAYMSPEQTGRMNRSVDSRSDLYSLGVTLYQILTGALPFTAVDPLEWVHCHIARQPAAPLEHRTVPAPVSAIIMRLLAKNAEDRYQAAAGLESDLRRCLTEWQSHGRIDPFPLGTRDFSDRLRIPEKLYGREREVDALLASFDRVVAGGRPELILVSGYSGVGKSAVVNELQKWLVPPRGLFSSGKFDQYKRDIPYATVAQAFQNLIRPLLIKPEIELSKWREDIHHALSPNGALLVDLIPELKLIIGEQPPLATLPPQEAKARAHLVLRRFIGVFARPAHPLALFLDDLQWLDAATLDFLEDLLVQQDLAHLLVVGAYRDNEVNAEHPLTRKLSAILQAGAVMQEVRLAPLDSGDLSHLIRDALHCDPQPALLLAKLVHEKTAGNPFFAIQFIHALVEERLLVFEHEEIRWRWDLSAIRAKGHTDNVVDLMISKLNRLPATTQRALQRFACIGNRADSSTLSAVLETAGRETEAKLWVALHEGLVVRDEDSWRFAHDRIQEASYSTIPTDLRAEDHLRIGRLLLAHTPAEKRDEAIFEIVNQLNRGAGLITSEDERHQLAELNLIAGKRSKASTAYASAIKYLLAGHALLADDSWERSHDLTFQLELNRAECEFVTGELTAALERVELLRLRAAGTVELATVTCLGIDVYMTLGQIDRAVEICLEYLRSVGIDWPMHPTEEQARSEYERIWSQLGNREIEEVTDFPLMSDPASIATLDVLTKILPAAYFTDLNLQALTICRAASLSIEHGNNDGSCLIYVWISMLAGHRFGQYKEAFRFGQLGYDLVEKRGLRRFQAAVYHSFATSMMPWMKPPSACAAVIRQAFEIASRIGDLTYAGYATLCLNSILIAAGEPLATIQSEAEKSLQFAYETKFGFAASMIGPQLGLIRTLRGLTLRFGDFDSADFDQSAFERDLERSPLAVRYYYWVRKLQARFYAGDMSSAIEASLNVRPLFAVGTNIEWVEYEFYSALTRGACCDSTRTDQGQDHFEALKAHHKQLAIWAENCPGPFEHRVALVGAEIARIGGRILDAEQLYEDAIHSAHANNFVHNEALANELAATFYRARGLEKVAKAYLRDARTLYARWGADGKVKQLDERFASMLDEPTSTSSSTIGSSARQLDAETAVRSSQALSSEVVLPALIDKLMRIAVEHAGAERGLLILIRDGEPRIDAEATTRPTGIKVALRQEPAAPRDLPESVLHYVTRTQGRVLLDDASADHVYSQDEYVRVNRSRSVLCLPIVKQAKLVGALYLENNLTPGAFTPDRVTVLTLLASQAAISLENAALYADLQLQVGLLQHLPVSAWTLKPDGTPDFVNQVWLEFAGQSAGFVRSHPEAWMTAVHPEDREMAAKAFWEGVRSEQGFAMETRLQRSRDGIYRWHLNQAVVLRDAEGKVLKFVGTTTDIDNQKRAQDALKESEAGLVRVIDTIPALTWTMFSDGSNEFLSKKWYEYTGLSVEESVGWGWQGAIHPDDLPALMKKWTEMLASGEPGEEETRLRRYDGVYRWFLIRAEPFRDETGTIIRWYGTSTDIDERRRAEDELKRSEAFLQEGQRLSRTGTFCWRVKTDEIIWSEELFQIFGFDPEVRVTLELIGSRVHPEDMHLMGDMISIAQRAESGFEYEHRIVMPDGSIKHIHLIGHAVHDAEGRPEYFGAAQDVTQYRLAEEAVAKAREALRQAQGDLARINRVTTMGELAASLAHEIKQPICGAITNSNLCLRKLGSDKPDLDELRAAVARFARDAKRAAEIIDKIRSQFEKSAPNQQTLDVNEITLETIALLRDETARHDISVRAELATDLPPIVGDRVQLQQVAMNLIVNSIEAMKVVDGIREMVIKSQRAENEQILVSISDTGVGIPRQLAERIFDPFFTTKTHGTGMGLRICRSIIEAHGGRLWATNNDGSGATFSFSIPYAAPSGGGAAPLTAA